MVFRKSTNQYTAMASRIDDNGAEWIQVEAHGAITAKTPYKIVMSGSGYLSAALASGTTLCMYGVAESTYATGDIGWFQIGGYAEDIVTPSWVTSVDQFYGLTSGVFQAIGSFTANVMAVGVEAASASTTNSFMLIPRWVTPT